MKHSHSRFGLLLMNCGSGQKAEGTNLTGTCVARDSADPAADVVLDGQDERRHVTERWWPKREARKIIKYVVAT
ncbi:hypothetical protein [Pseudomonas panipatensis]|uniref:hypothetical protein n=1 Tax=Pseudomonas panipatensis TaxID=428992 RepID=UPI000B7E5EF7|nr:hypothetical protein [Pseudomonas panipatensis]